MCGELLHDLQLFQCQFFILLVFDADNFHSVKLFGVLFIIALLDNGTATFSDDLVEYPELMVSACDHFDLDVL